MCPALWGYFIGCLLARMHDVTTLVSYDVTRRLKVTTRGCSYERVRCNKIFLQTHISGIDLIWFQTTSTGPTIESKNIVSMRHPERRGRCQKKKKKTWLRRGMTVFLSIVRGAERSKQNNRNLRDSNRPVGKQLRFCDFMGARVSLTDRSLQTPPSHPPTTGYLVPSIEG